jgi:phosphoglycolate phosphatase-like HAD superfamily hydrolase
MIIGIDLDGTLIETNATILAARELGYEFSQKDVTRWDYKDFPEDMRAKVHEYFRHPKFMADDAVAIEGAQDKVRQWAAAGHTVILVTARVEEIREATIRMMERLFPEITDINFVDFNQSKVMVMQEKKMEAWVDDAPHGVTDSMDIGMPTYLVSNNYTKYNWHVKDDPRLKAVVPKIADIKDF